MEITIEIPNEEFEVAKRGLLYLHPIPGDENNESIMSEDVWLKEWLRQFLRDEITKGLQIEEAHKIRFENDNGSVV